MAQLPSRKDELIGRINELLRVPSLGPPHGTPFMDSLGVALEMVILFSEAHPTEALEVLWHVIDGLPTAFDTVTDAMEMAEFCTFLVEDTLRVAVRERLHIAETIARILAAYVDERDGGGRFYAIPELLANPKLPKRVRDLAAAAAGRVQGRTADQQGWLKALAASAPKTSA